MFFTPDLRAHLGSLATGHGLGTISDSSAVVRFVQGGVVKPSVVQQDSVAFDFAKLQAHCADLGFHCVMTSPNRIDVTISDARILAFVNLVKEGVTLIGFDGTPSHSHGSTLLTIDADRYVELDEYDLLTAIRVGDVLIVERFKNEKLADRWLAHKLEPFDLKYIEPNEELRIHRVHQPDR